MIDIRWNTTRVMDHTLVCSDSLESIMPCAEAADEVAQLRCDVNVIPESATPSQTKWIFGALY